MTRHFVIMADYDMCGDICPCLVRLAGNTLEQANKVLNNLTPKDLQGGTNPRIEEVARKDCWWLDGGLD